jgi:hypothetical protein
MIPDVDVVSSAASYDSDGHLTGTVENGGGSLLTVYPSGAANLFTFQGGRQSGIERFESVEQWRAANPSDR